MLTVKLVLVLWLQSFFLKFDKDPFHNLASSSLFPRNYYFKEEFMKICVIEDEELLAKALCKGLANLNYEAEYFLDGEEGSRQLENITHGYDLAIII